MSETNIYTFVFKEFLDSFSFIMKYVILVILGHKTQTTITSQK